MRLRFAVAGPRDSDLNTRGRSSSETWFAKEDASDASDAEAEEEIITTGRSGGGGDGPAPAE